MPWGHASAEWTSQELEQLREWRTQGVTDGEIGMRLRRTAKAVQSKARALGIASGYVRVAPQRQPKGSGVRGTERAGKVTLPPLPSLRERHE